MPEQLPRNDSSLESSEAHVDWAKFYEDKIENRFGGLYEGYHAWRLGENAPWLDFVEAAVPVDGKVCEVGIGAGTGLIKLVEDGFNCTGVDNQREIFPLVARNYERIRSLHDQEEYQNYPALAVPINAKAAESSRSFTSTILPEGSLKLVAGDMRHLPFSDKEFSVVFNQGMLEHYPEAEIIAAIKESLRVGERFVFSVPTDLAADPVNRRALGLTVNTKSGTERDPGNTHDENFWPVAKWEELIAVAGGVIEKKMGYWVAPEFNSDLDIKDAASLTLVHPKPEELESYYGKGLMACYVVAPSN